MLKSNVGRRLALLSQPQLFNALINDAYKPKMHKIYATYLRGVTVDFALNVRRSPFPLRKIEQQVSMQTSELCVAIGTSGSALLFADVLIVPILCLCKT